MVSIEQGAARYIGFVKGRFGGDQARLKDVVCAVYGASHEQSDEESDGQYLERCLEQDFVDGFQGAAMYQDLFVLACNEVNR